MQLPYSKACLVHALFSKISKVESFLPHILCTPVDIFSFVIGFGCYHSQMHFQLQTKIALARIQVLTAAFSVTHPILSVVLSVSVSTQPWSSPLRLFFFCWMCYSVAISSVPVELHHIPYRTGILGKYQNWWTNVKQWKRIWFCRMEC